MCVCVWVGLSDGINAARRFNRISIRRCILIFRDIILFLYVLVAIAKEQNIIIACRGELKKIWLISVFKQLYYARPESLRV